jgi:hypothetical protein
MVAHLASGHLHWARSAPVFKLDAAHTSSDTWLSSKEASRGGAELPSPSWFEAHREALNRAAIAFRNHWSGLLFKRPKDAAVTGKAALPRARQVLRRGVPSHAPR